MEWFVSEYHLMMSYSICLSSNSVQKGYLNVCFCYLSYFSLVLKFIGL